MKVIRLASRFQHLSKRCLAVLLLDLLAVILLFGFIFLSPIVYSSPLKRDEEVIFFPTNAYLDEKTGSWMIPIHGWVFEPEQDSAWKVVFIDELVDILDLDNEKIDNQLFWRRVLMFLVDNERNKALQIKINSHNFSMNPSQANGHFTGLAQLTSKQLGKNPFLKWLRYEIITREQDPRIFEGRAQVVNPIGISVISDIDDTIKISNVENRKELLANTFTREFQPVPGMSDVYQRWAQAGVLFHYVSASPWQLYPALSEFLKWQRCPNGSFNLQEFRVKDRSVFNLITPSEKFKLQTLQSILRTFPQREFVLIGDSGEKDPEIYAKLAKQYPDQVIHIFIRDISITDANRQRFGTLFGSLSKRRWTVFRDAKELEGVILR